MTSLLSLAGAVVEVRITNPRIMTECGRWGSCRSPRKINFSTGRTFRTAFARSMPITDGRTWVSLVYYIPYHRIRVLRKSIGLPHSSDSTGAEKKKAPHTPPKRLRKMICLHNCLEVRNHILEVMTLL